MLKIRKTIGLLIFISLFLSYDLYAQTPLKVTFIDVGHGDCILIQTPDDGIKGNGKYEGEVILIDGGERIEGKRVIIPYLESHGIKENKPIDFIIMTHCDADHVGGLIPVIEAYQIKAILDPGYPGKSRLYKKTFCKLAKDEKGCNFYRPLVGTLIKKEGDNLDWGSELEVKVLHSDEHADKSNNSSIVMWLKYGEVSFLFVGDAEGKLRKDSPDALKFTEKEMVEKYDGKLKSTFLKAGHHGSESASTNAFINAVSPKYVVICAGNKKFSGTLLPDKSVIKRYENRGIKIYRTDRDDQKKSSDKTSGDDQIIITSDGTLKGTNIGYEDIRKDYL
ncbi:MAG TPA: ComEC/Rec2 family competence protein [Candidatus Wunengus sp. YC60]|uniref:ComEC/Rec2 family competence protein n=1 Tax=Candidatus Wunengus sp. YC60 TaxID=3367697 RepID=UPI004028BD56